MRNIYRTASLCAAIVLSAASGACAQTRADKAGPLPRPDVQRGTLAGSPLDHLPRNVHLVSRFGMRPDWSPDQKQIVFLDGPLGQIHLLDVATGQSRNISSSVPNFGFLRVQFLSNGDLLLCAPARQVQQSTAGPGRFEGALWVYRAPFTAPPQPLGPSCWEGVTASPTSLKIAWNRSDVRFDSPNTPADFVGDIWTGDIGYDAKGRAYLNNVAKVFDRSALPYSGVPEVQNFRGADDREIILTGYGAGQIEVFGYDLQSRILRNYSNSPVYEEAEGVAPNGEWMLVERNIESASAPDALDIWRLWFATNRWERMTHFNRYRGDQYPFYASNPVVSPDGKRFAFQLSIDGPTEGQGQSILIYDFPR